MVSRPLITSCRFPMLVNERLFSKAPNGQVTPLHHTASSDYPCCQDRESYTDARYYTFFPSTTASSSVKLRNGRFRASSKLKPILSISRLRRESKETIVRFRPMPISVPSRDMLKLTLSLRLHALHRLVQPILIRLLLCPTLAAPTGRKKKVTEELQCLRGILRADRSQQHNPLRKLDLLRPLLLRP